MFEFHRLKRLFSEYKLPNKHSVIESQISQSMGKRFHRPSSQSIVVSLPPVMNSFCQTREGMGNVIVSTKTLQRKFTNLWYESLVCPRQTISNSFILAMAAERLKFSKSMKDRESTTETHRPFEWYHQMPKT